MNTKIRISIATFLLMALLLPVFSVKAEAPADILESYVVTIIPRADGSLAMDYQLTNYCTTSNWPWDTPYLQIGVPNSSFTITDWGPKDGAHPVVSAEAINDDGTFVQLNFDKKQLPKNGDCFNLYFAIVQQKMAYPDSENSNVTFKFIPSGWTFPIEVTSLYVAWKVPDNPALLKLTEPKPTGSTSDKSLMIWQWNNPVMDASSMFRDAAIKLAYDQKAFTLAEDAITKNANGNGGVSDGQVCLTVLIIVIAIIVILFILTVIFEWYGSGDGLGPAIIAAVDTVGDVLSSSGGGSGGSSGHGSGCACAGCACACACAGGGKVGCSRKAIGISCLNTTIEKYLAQKGK